MPKPRKRERAVNKEVTWQMLKALSSRYMGMGYQKAKWIDFCEELLKRGYRVTLKEAMGMVSKYVTVHGINDDFYRVRFSNHKPNKKREEKGDCDFFVGVTHFGITNTGQAIHATLKHFGAI